MQTDSSGNVLKETTLQEAIKDLEKLPEEIVVGLCAALIVAHHSFDWIEIFNAIIKDIKVRL